MDFTVSVCCVPKSSMFDLEWSFLLGLSFRQEEVEQLKARLEKVEKERSELKLNHDLLEAKVSVCILPLLVSFSC